MIKFIEIYENSLGYDESIGTCKSSFSLRELYLNPDYIISMTESHRLKQKSKSAALIDGINENASFTELTVATPGQTMSKVYNVVGRPDSFINKIEKLK